MAAISDGLPNGGRTEHFQITYDDSLSPADGLGRASGLQGKCEDIFALISSWFVGVDFIYSFPIELRIMNDTGGAGWTTPTGFQVEFGWSPTIEIKAGSGTPVEVMWYLVVSEVTEMFMASQAKGWGYDSLGFLTADNEGSKGEGLSRFLGVQFQITRGAAGAAPSGYGVTGQWLNSPRTDYVNNNPADKDPNPITGCTTLFLFYLHDQRGLSIRQIIAAASSTLSGVYHNLTGGSDGWPPFIDLVNKHYPPKSKDYKQAGESVFPVSNLTEFRWPGVVTCGYDYEASVILDRPALADFEVRIASDDPKLVQAPAAVTVPLGATWAPVTFTSPALPLPFTPQPVNVHAAYAGNIITIAVVVSPPQVVAITLARTTIKSGEHVTATVKLNYASKLGPVEVDIVSSAPGFAAAPATVVIPQDHDSWDFTIAAPRYDVPFKTAHSFIDAKYAGSVATVELFIRPRVLLGLLKSISLWPKTVPGGGVSHGAVTLEEAVPVQTKILLEALDPAMGPQGPLPLPGSPSSAAHVPASITIPAGQTSGTFTVTTTRANSPRDQRLVRIGARATGRVRYATLMIDG